ncbi:ABC transporter ATP-binding protein [Ensifer aridi]|uniref:ABC transporter ATP-binding protein n=1 Tax=Ensifer aridi TaxID=1708715 RepID=UPI000A1137EF|nr:ABC transporter ATP-binding protein [Ensifer aridi]
MSGPVENAPLLSVRGLTLTLKGTGVNLVSNVSFDLQRGQVLGVVGESGCGKSVTALSMLRIAHPSIVPSAGEVLFQGEDILKANAHRMRQVRGGEIAMIFQEPMTSLNPVFTVGDQIVEALRAHQSIGRKAARTAAIEMLYHVGIPSPAQRIDVFPHQMSGGMRQRAMIAMALACKPKLLIADEPTTALDVTIQAQIIELLRRLGREFGMAMIIVTHDLGVVADIADDVLIMYAGRVIERCSAADLFRRPRHPYTEGLLRSVPPLDADVERLPTIPGTVPLPHAMPIGCRFADRCPDVRAPCRTLDPPLIRVGSGHLTACIREIDYRAGCGGLK